MPSPEQARQQRHDAAATKPRLRRFVRGQTQRGVPEGGERPFERCALGLSVGARGRGDDFAEFGHEGDLIATAQPGQVRAAQQVGQVVARQHLSFAQAGRCRQRLLQMIGLTAALDAQASVDGAAAAPTVRSASPSTRRSASNQTTRFHSRSNAGDHLGQTLQSPRGRVGYVRTSAAPRRAAERVRDRVGPPSAPARWWHPPAADAQAPADRAPRWKRPTGRPPA